MGSEQAHIIIDALSQGIDPKTGELLSTQHCFNQPDIIRALYAAREALAKSAAVEKRKANLPENAGKPWHEEEEALLISQFEDGQNLAKLARALGRTQASVQARLVKLGKLGMPVYAQSD